MILPAQVIRAAKILNPPMTTKLLTEHPFYKDHDIVRDDDQIPCECWGVAQKVKCTDEERVKFGVGTFYDCGAVAFICVKCETRWVGTESSPDPGW